MEKRSASCAIALTLAAAVAAAGCGERAARQSEVRTSLQRTLAQPRPPYVTADAEGRNLWKLTRQFYERRQHAPAWIKGTAPLPQVAELIAALNAASEEGLDPQLYNVALSSRSGRPHRGAFCPRRASSPPKPVNRMSGSPTCILKYASDLADGLSDLARADTKWQIRPEKFDPAATLEEALENNRIEKSLRELTPENPQYLALRRVLAEYRAQAANGGWPTVPANVRLAPGQTESCGRADCAAAVGVRRLCRALSRCQRHRGLLHGSSGGGQTFSATAWTDR